MERPEVRTRAAAAVVILGIFCAFAGDGIHGYFAPDEMMNLYRAWFPSLGQLAGQDRPLGALVYRILFALFGLHPLPYRLFCLALILINLYLLYRLAALLSGSREIATLACLLGAYHAHLADLYYASATIYDLLCFLFFFWALTAYIAIRSGGARLDWRHTGILLLLYLCALGSKEMAVTLPAMIVLYEWIYGGKGVLQSRFLWLSVPLTVAYAIYKTAGARAMTLNPEYAPHFSARAFLVAWRHYLPDLFYGAIRFSDLRVILLWVTLLVFALLLRRRDLLFAWCLTLVGALPFVFIAPRGFFAMYMTLPGWYVYAAALLLLLRGQAMRAFPKMAAALGVRTEQLVLFAAVAAIAIPIHLREKPLGNSWVPGAFEQTRPMLEQLAARYPRMPHAAKILFLSDPCPPHDYILYFMLALRYRDADLRVDRAKDDASLAGQTGHYDRVFSWGTNGLQEVARTPATP